MGWICSSAGREGECDDDALSSGEYEDGGCVGSYGGGGPVGIGTPWGPETPHGEGAIRLLLGEDWCENAPRCDCCEGE